MTEKIVDKLLMIPVIEVNKVEVEVESIVCTLYSEFLMISIFISSKSCSEMQSWKKGATQRRIRY